MNSMPRLVAFYLPQFHRIPENDLAWGDGFTEWSNVQKATPLFKGHNQPRVPLDEIGYYNLDSIDSIAYQACLAKRYGITSFAYWYYWMGHGKRLLQKPLDLMLKSKDIDHQFCLAWANESWTGVWHGNPNTTIAEQQYEPPRMVIDHCKTLASYMNDDRYTRVEGRPLLLIYKPLRLPSYYLRSIREGLDLLGHNPFVVAISNTPFDWSSHGFDGLNINSLGKLRANASLDIYDWIYWGIKRRIRPHSSLRKIPYQKYAVATRISLEHFNSDFIYPTCIPDWDNTPRSGMAGLVLTGSTPLHYRQHLMDCILAVSNRPQPHQIVFIKSWNEWAEGNYLEPDTFHEYQYLQCTAEALEYSRLLLTNG